MVVYQPRRRTSRWIWVAVAAVVAIALGLLGFWLWQQSQPSADEQIAASVDTMTGQLDVLRISHYTPDTVQGGQVVAGEEYDAALEDIARVRREWEEIAPLVDPSRAEDINSRISRIESLIQQRQPAEEVDREAGALIDILHAL